MDIFRISRRGEEQRYNVWRTKNRDKLSQRLLLWHGSTSEKFIGILSQGLRTGIFEKSNKGMFGGGIYFADMSGKSAQYSASSFSQGLLLLCEVEVGKDPLCLVNCNQKASAVMRAEHKVGVFAQGRVGHKAWMDARVVRQSLNGILMPDTSKGRVMNHNAPTLAYNEYVVYDPAQVRQRYLFHLVFKVSR